MVVRDGASIRKARLKALMDLIEAHEGDPAWTRRKTLGMFMLQTGLKTRTINEMVDECIEAGIMSNDGEYLHLDM